MDWATFFIYIGIATVAGYFMKLLAIAEGEKK